MYSAFYKTVGLGSNGKDEGFKRRDIVTMRLDVLQQEVSFKVNGNHRSTQALTPGTWYLAVCIATSGGGRVQIKRYQQY